MSEKPNVLVRAWRTVRDFVRALFGPDKAADDRTTRQGEVHPAHELRGRTMGGGMGGW